MGDSSLESQVELTEAQLEKNIGPTTMAMSQKTFTLTKGASRINKSRVFQFGLPETGRTLFVWLPAGDAPSGPPLGSYVATKGIAPADFCKKWNDRTKPYKKGTPLAAYINFQGAKLFDFYFETPPTEWLIRQAAGAITDHDCCRPEIATCLPITIAAGESVVTKEQAYYQKWWNSWKSGLTDDREVDGVITLKHCYEIASFKLQDKKYKYGDYTMKQMVQKVINTAHRCNIDIVSEKNIAPEEHSKIMADIKNRERMRREQAEASAEKQAEMRRTLAKERKLQLNIKR